MFPFNNQRSSFPPSLPMPDGDFIAGEGDQGTERPQGGRARRGGGTKNIVPVEIIQLINYREENGPFMIHGIEVLLEAYFSQV